MVWLLNGTGGPGGPPALLVMLVPLIVAGYILLLLRRRKGAFRYSNLSLVKQAAQASTWRRRTRISLENL